MKNIILITAITFVLLSCKNEGADFRDDYTGNWSFSTYLVQSDDYLSNGTIQQISFNEDVSKIKCRISKKKGSKDIIILTTLKDGKLTDDNTEIKINPTGKIIETNVFSTFIVSEKNIL